MARSANFTKDDFIKCAGRLIAEGGPDAATTSAILQGVGAPVGSFYHRFASRDSLMGELWLGLAEDYQREFFELLRIGDVVSAALFTPRWVRGHPLEARILLMYRREDFASAKWPPEMSKRAETLGAELAAGLQELAEKIDGGSPADALVRVRFALLDVPMAAIRRYLVKNEPIPSLVDDLVRECCAALISPGEEPVSGSR
ncbi:TetR/AcrR family transcriptional regulator [Telmatospirillum sp.]|uniref:TetR/AcrR family transcriptional regulator n=1 Tax=Telmatospirillum sp. TaxID=2079197 RepID=UPI00283C36B0|nr:TetR/AcrR family transcriptional regulator [Telmatospirillum sp.]MDR3439658.1 TetR/AcrR family transcriptional regulator [Telmatospirillum sp.]